MTNFHANLKTSWVCIEHSRHLVNDMFLRVALLFIRRQCQKINSNLALKEQDLSDANKRGEQYGATK